MQMALANTPQVMALHCTALKSHQTNGASQFASTINHSVSVPEALNNHNWITD